MSESRILLLALVGSVIAVAGCDSSRDSASNATSSSDAASTSPSFVPTSSAASQPAAVPATAVTQASWAPDALEELLAPIALYPDALLAQILAASVNAQEVLDAGNWLLQNQDLKGDALDAAAEDAGFGPAMRSLVQFPTVVDMMCQEIDWTRQLGSAFTSDQASVLDAIQRLRTQAARAGNLQSTPEQTVETTKEEDRVIVEVKPTDPKVVYVPQYDPRTVYAPSPTSTPTQTTTSSESTVSTGAAVAGGLLAFGAGVVLSHALDDDDCYPHWSTGVVFYGPRPFYPPAYVYRPAYGPAFRPAYRYVPPPGYRHSYNNIDVNVDRNIVVNHNTYFNRFEDNRNLRVGDDQPRLDTRRVARSESDQRPATHDNEAWRGQSTYAGARERAPGEQSDRRSIAQDTANTRPREHVASPDVASVREEVRDTRGNERPPPHVDRGYAQSARELAGATSAAGAVRDHTFSGITRNDTALERTASARGHASVAGRSGHVGRHRR